MVLKMTNCPSCDATKKDGYYLCSACWFGLSLTTRRRLWRKDGKAMARYAALYDQLANDVPLSEIEVEE